MTLLLLKQQYYNLHSISIYYTNTLYNITYHYSDFYYTTLIIEQLLFFTKIL